MDKKILSDLLRAFERRREARAHVLTERRQQVYERMPRIRQIDDTLRTTAAAVLRAALEAGEDPAEAIERLRVQNLSLQQERARLLLENGLSADFLDDKPDCTLCDDHGYIGNQPCSCLKNQYAQRLTQQLSVILPIADQNFTSFRLDYYPEAPDGRLGMSPRENMEYNFNICIDYASHFSMQSPNLFLFGSSGLGKTFLSTSIAKIVAEHGFSVAYDTAIHVLSCYESVKFNTPDAQQARQDIRKFEHADLLILDDLGTEMSTAFTASVFYSLLNTRLMAHRPMIVNTNLLPADLEKRYSQAIASRLLGDFIPLRFFGNDIRQIKRRQASHF